MTDYGQSDDELEQDGPLDLTVDVLDLRKRRQQQEAVATPAPLPPTPAPSTQAVKTATPSPVVAAEIPPPSAPKPPLYPQHHQPPYFGSPYSGPSIAGLPFFYPGLGGTASYSAFFESKLAEIGAGNPAVDLSALALAAAHHDALRQQQQQQQQQQQAAIRPEGLLMPAKKEPVIVAASTPVKLTDGNIKKSSLSSMALEPGVKMVLKNGVLVKKQKQRRYRTERPFGCEHCTARFTLRSNMERHIKQQHPDIWSTRPRGHRRSACALSTATKTSSALPTMVELKSSIIPAALPIPVALPTQQQQQPAISEQVRQAVQQKLNSKKRRNSEQSEEEEEEDDEEVEEEEEEDGALVIDEPKAASDLPVKSAEDLASVSKLINNAVAQNFQQYFPRETPEQPHQRQASPSDEDMDEMGECTSVSDGHSGGGSDFGGQPDAKAGKKKSAYSNAPHRVSCPYCSRKFPWTSSLRRHILTHTGQKPYKCPQCPLWFTTKSNCDRHLLRKHGNHSSGGGGGGGHSSSNSNHSADNARNVPDRPYKCALCPSSTFATSDNLKKHVDNKHCPGHGRPSSPESMQDKRQSSSSPEAGQENQLPFKCHLCEDFPAGFSERHQVLDHLKREHVKEFADLLNKGALLAAGNGESAIAPSTHTSDEGEDYESIRGKFPDYVNRKVHLIS